MSMIDNDPTAMGIAIGAVDDIKRLSEYIFSNKFIDDLLKRMNCREKELLDDVIYKQKYFDESEKFKDLGKRFDIAMALIEKDEKMLEEYLAICAKKDMKKISKRRK